MYFLVPPVKRFTPKKDSGGSFPLEFTIAIEGKQAKQAADYLLNDFRPDFNAHAIPIPGKSPDLLVRVKRDLLKSIKDLPKSKNLRSQAYRLKWQPGKKSCLEADTAIGALHGAMTFRQILAAIAEGINVPAGVIEDWPDLKWRGLQDDIARGRTFSMDHAKRQIQRLAELKGNMYQLYMETNFQFPRHPDAARPGAMTPEDARELEAFASRFGVTLLPQINTLFHMELLLSKPAYAHLRELPDSSRMICPLHPETRPLLKDLLNDIMDAFESPVIPVGLDEVWHLGQCKRCEKKDPGKIFRDHILFLHKVITARGRRMMIWGDMLLDEEEFSGSTANGPAEWAEDVLNQLPRDIIICDWQYISTNDTTRHFIDKGYDTFACNYMKGPIHGRPFPFDSSAARHTSRLYSQARRSGASGVIQTSWGSVGANAFENFWLFFTHSLSTAWKTAQPISLRFLAENWALIEMGIDGAEYEDVIARLSVPLFGGTGKRSITIEDTGPRFPLFHRCKNWWRSMGKDLLEQEKAFTEDLRRRIHAMHQKAKRGESYLAMLGLPIMQRQIKLDEMDKIVQAAHLAEPALLLKKSDPGRKKKLKKAADLIRQHASIRERILKNMMELSARQGIDDNLYQGIERIVAAINQRADWLEAGKPFEKVFWKESETPYYR